MNFHYIEIDLPFIFGGLESYLLVELIQKHKYYEREDLLVFINGKSCFFYTYESIQQRLPFSRYQLDTIIKNLKIKNVIEVYKKGLPARNYFYVNFAILYSLRESYKLVCNNPTTNKVEMLQTRELEIDEFYNKSLNFDNSDSLRVSNKVETLQTCLKHSNNVEESQTIMQESDDNINNNLLITKENKKDIKYFFSDSKYFNKYKVFEKDMKKGLKTEMQNLGKKIDFEYHWEKFHSKEENFQKEKENWENWFLDNFKKQIPEGKVKFIGPPTLEEMQSFAIEKGYSKTLGAKVYEYYSAGNWADSKGTPVKNWKQKMISVWFNDENKEKYKDKEEMKTKTNPFEHMTPEEIRQIQIENGSLGAPKYRRSMVADPKQGHINEIGEIFDGILNGLK